MMCPRAADFEAPLFDWPERREIDRLEEMRRALTDRILALPRHSHRRVELEARLRALTLRQLDLARALEQGTRS